MEKEMRKSVRSLVLILIISLTCLAGSALADTVLTWKDNTIVWPNWGTPAENSTPSIGEPMIIGGTVGVSDAGYLKYVTYSFLNPPGWQFSTMKPGDLFLDTDGDQKWEYLLSLGYDGSAHKYVPTGNVQLFQFKSDVGMNDGAGYLITGADNTGYWSGYGIRNNHPYAYVNYDNGIFQGFGSISGGISTLPGSSVTYSLPDGVVKLDEFRNLTFGFTENCANDVVLENVRAPEPGSLILLGTGLLGLAAFGRKKLRP
jgi:hypothetical protein